ADAGRGTALRTPVLVSGCSVGQVDLEEVRQRGQPREHIRELELQVGPLARADRPGELPEFLGEPPEGGVHASLLIARQVDLAHRRLEVLQIHTASVSRQPARPTLNAWKHRRTGAVKSHPRDST